MNKQQTLQSFAYPSNIFPLPAVELLIICYESDHKIKILGLEDKTLYENDLREYVAVAKQKEEVAGFSLFC